MRVNRAHIIIGVAVLALLVFLFWAFSNFERPVNWRVTFDENSKEPYGTFLTNELLKNYFADHEIKVMTDSIADYLLEKKEAANYVFIGGQIFMDSVSLAKLVEFVEKGNSAFIASTAIPKLIIDTLYKGEYYPFQFEDYYTIVDSSAYFNFEHPDLKYQDSSYHFVYEFDFKGEDFHWGYLPKDELPFASLGTVNNDSLVNFFHVKYGEGDFYFHTNPILFTNHSLISEGGKEYVNRAFAHLVEGDIFWDKRSRLPYHFNDFDWWNQKRTFDSEGPLKYVLAQPSLAWAWYILLAMGLLYFLFRAKRQQRIIPVLEENRNTSLEFISTIGRMYFVQQNHRKIALDKIKLWKSFVRERYQIPTKEMDEKFEQQLANKSNFPKTDIQRIVRLSKNIESSDMLSENSLIDFHKLLDRFYKNSK